MLDSWHSFFFNSFDPAGFVSFDKPPVAIWLQAASAKLLGFSALSILLAQVIAGLVAILLLYVMVRNYWGGTAAALAALLLAVTPVNVAVDRSNNTESCLIAGPADGVWLAMRAAETGRLAMLCAAMAALGIGFNVKMGAALVLAPVFALTFSLAWHRRRVSWHLRRQAIAGTVLIVVSLSWATSSISRPPASGPTRAARSTTPCSSWRSSTMARPLPATDSARSRRRHHPTGAAADPVAVVRPTTCQRAFTACSVRAPPRKWRGCCRLAGLALAWLGPAGAGRAASAPDQRRHLDRLAGPLLVRSEFCRWPRPHLLHRHPRAAARGALSGIAVAELWSRWTAGTLARWVVPALVLATVAWQNLSLHLAGRGHQGPLVAWGLARFDRRSARGDRCGCLLPIMGRAHSLGSRHRPFRAARVPGITAASVVLERPNVAVPIADMAAH